MVVSVVQRLDVCSWESKVPARKLHPPINKIRPYEGTMKTHWFPFRAGG